MSLPLFGWGYCARGLEMLGLDGALEIIFVFVFFVFLSLFLVFFVFVLFWVVGVG